MNNNNYDDVLDEIRPSSDEIIKKKIRKIGFCRALVWVTINLKRFGVVHAPELAHFLKIDTSYAMRILREMEKLGLVKSIDKGMVEFVPTYEKGENNNVMVIEKFFDYALEKLRNMEVLR
jgi:phage anti-repressor protein